MKVIVTGATGHLGRYVVAELAAAGHEIVAASRSGALPAAAFGADTNASRASVRPLALDLTHDDAVATLARAIDGETALIHLAAWHPPSTATTTATDRAQLLEANVLGTMRVLESVRRVRDAVRSVVYASTFEVYAELEPQTRALTEASPVAPRSDYGACKLSGEDHLLAFAAEEGTRVVALRLPAIYGPGEHTPRALPNFLRAVAKGERPTILGDGADLRDQIHVRDAALAFRLALSDTARGVYNIADGQPHSIAELARVALELRGMPGGPESRPRQKPRFDYHMSIERSRRELAFSPRVELKTGMAEELAWLRSLTSSGELG